MMTKRIAAMTLTTLLMVKYRILKKVVVLGRSCEYLLLTSDVFLPSSSLDLCKILHHIFPSRVQFCICSDYIATVLLGRETYSNKTAQLLQPLFEALFWMIEDPGASLQTAS